METPALGGSWSHGGASTAPTAAASLVSTAATTLPPAPSTPAATSAPTPLPSLKLLWQGAGPVSAKVATWWLAVDPATGNVWVAASRLNKYWIFRRPGGLRAPILRWTFHTGGPVGSSMAIAGAVVYVAGGDHTVYAVDEKTGSQLWALRVTGQPGAIAVVGTRLYLGTDLGQLIAIGGAP